MNILVTGHLGFIGQNLVQQLQNNGHHIVGYEWGDSTEVTTLLDCCNIDAVIHVGAISSTVERNVNKIMVQNYDFSVVLIEACNKRNIRFQYASSASVYGFNREFTEESPVDPKTPYAWSKYLFERYVSQRHWNMPVQGFRYFNVHGPHEDHKRNQASPYHKFAVQAKTMGCVEVFENSQSYLRDFVHVDTVVNVHKEFLTIDESGIWNVGTGKPKSFLDVASQFNVPVKIVPMPQNLVNNYQAYTCADTSKLIATLSNNGRSINLQ